jgi:hypothetical protein
MARTYAFVTARASAWEWRFRVCAGDFLLMNGFGERNRVSGSVEGIRVRGAVMCACKSVG